VLQEALRLDPELPTLRYQLGLAFHAIGDEADAEAELREAESRAPDSAAAHNYLGIVLFQEGNATFRACSRPGSMMPEALLQIIDLGIAIALTGSGSAGAAPAKFVHKSSYILELRGKSRSVKPSYRALKCGAAKFYQDGERVGGCGLEDLQLTADSDEDILSVTLGIRGFFFFEKIFERFARMDGVGG
jgi:tetratricopeptide (TPR) repeat protein